MHRVQQKWVCCFCGVLCGDVALMMKECSMDPCAAGHSGSSCCCLRVAPHCSHRPSGTSQGDHVLTRRDHRGREEFWGLTTDAALQSHNTHNQCFFSVFSMPAAVVFTSQRYSDIKVTWMCLDMQPRKQLIFLQAVGISPWRACDSRSCWWVKEQISN